MANYNIASKELKSFLDEKVVEFNHPDFIKNDPICIPRSFSKKQDIEIAGLFSAVFAWGNRPTIINKAKKLMALMDNAPFQFCTQHTAADIKKLLNFKHRTFQTTDLLYFIEFLNHHYSKYPSLENAFTFNLHKKDITIEKGLSGFYNYFFSLPNIPERTRKHIATPEKRSTCKRLNMYLRWMVRRDTCGVDLGIWEKISPSQLVCPIDVHVARVGRRLSLLKRQQTDWQSALELTETLRNWDPNDPVKYDFALFGLGVSNLLI